MNGNDHQHELDDELLSAYIDGELSDSERAAVEARLASDPEAQHLLHQLRSVSQDVQSLPLIVGSPRHPRSSLAADRANSDHARDDRRQRANAGCPNNHEALGIPRPTSLDLGLARHRGRAHDHVSEPRQQRPRTPGGRHQRRSWPHRATRSDAAAPARRASGPIGSRSRRSRTRGEIRGGFYPHQRRPRRQHR